MPLGQLASDVNDAEHAELRRLERGDPSPPAKRPCTAPPQATAAPRTVPLPRKLVGFLREQGRPRLADSINIASEQNLTADEARRRGLAWLHGTLKRWPESGGTSLDLGEEGSLAIECRSLDGHGVPWCWASYDPEVIFDHVAAERFSLAIIARDHPTWDSFIPTRRRGCVMSLKGMPLHDAQKNLVEEMLFLEVDRGNEVQPFRIVQSSLSGNPPQPPPTDCTPRAFRGDTR